MRTLRLMNVYLHLDDQHDHIIVDRYKIFQLNGHFFQTKHIRKHTQNAYTQFDGKQENSIIFQGGITGYKNNPIKRKLIDDILIIGSILTGSNWCLCSRIKSPAFPLIPHPYLENIDLNGKNEIEDAFKKALNKIKNSDWQKQYENGFHLRMLLNHSNITNSESRFLSNVVIWEWLYPHLKNPNGATSNDESDKLNIIMNYILDYFWPQRKFKGKKNIFIAIRNQLAHSGKLPINRLYAESWMTLLKWETEDGGRGIKDYVSFFDKLTQVIVLKTLDIDAKHIIENDLNNFLTNGQL